ncbi:MAG TPA: DUF4129 domain-containing protein [Candidatus Hydrogenedens sp.]|nr:DUF4129 domain-containing protein [Candidatus Hydrogenedens sp.]HPP57937.1 DUF4129 domain-containing protein [Candidatus Hydrogenedens sp.]
MRIPDWMEDGSLSWSDSKKEKVTSDEKEQEEQPPVLVSTDFTKLNVKTKYSGEYIVGTEWTLTDTLLSIVNPFLILVLLWSIVFFLLDVRYIYTEVNDINLRFVVFFLVLGIVGVNRIFATESVESGISYGAGLALAISLYVMVSTSVYGTGSVIYNLVTGNSFLAFLSNMGVVIFLWWLTNRITYECCIDENPNAGEIGIATSVNKAFQKTVRKEETAHQKEKMGTELFYELEAVDPTQLSFKDPSVKDITFNIMGFGERLSRIPAGISVLFFSIPVLGIFSLGLRILVNGGEQMVNVGWVYLGLFVFSSMTLLVMTSLGGLREYYKNRRVYVPSMLGVTWVLLGIAIIVVAMVCATFLPLPTLPKPFYVAEHQTDPWVRNSHFQLNPIVVAPVVEIWQQQMILQKLRYVVIFILIFVSSWVAFSAVKRFIVHWWQVSLQRGGFLVRWLMKLLERRKGKVKIKRKISIKSSKSIKFVNSLSDPNMSQKFTPNEHIEYAYQALCALAEDLGVPKKLNETPLEFLANLPNVLEVLREEIEELTLLYQTAVFSPIKFDSKILDRLRKFWISYTRVRNRLL